MDQRKLLERELNILRDRLLLMGGEAELSIQRAIHALMQRDSDVANQVIESDSVIDRLELEIDRLSVELLTLRRPVAKELRLVISISKITPILERIADHAANIAKAVPTINQEPPLGEFDDLPVMVEKAVEMLRVAMEAFLAEDAVTARKIIAEDRIIDSSYKHFFGELIGMIVTNPATTASAAQMLFVAKHLERIGDYVKDICELTVYLSDAVFIKHSPKEDE